MYHTDEDELEKDTGWAKKNNRKRKKKNTPSPENSPA